MKLKSLNESLTLYDYLVENHLEIQNNVHGKKNFVIITI